MSNPEHQSFSRERRAYRRSVPRRAPAAVNKPPISERRNYAGLEILPENAYRRIRVEDEGTGISTTNFECKFVGSDGTSCHKAYDKSTNLIVHYQRHINLRPFACQLCGISFTQNSTLSRHNKAFHSDSNSMAVTTAFKKRAGP